MSLFHTRAKELVCFVIWNNKLILFKYLVLLIFVQSLTLIGSVLTFMVREHIYAEMFFHVYTYISISVLIEVLDDIFHNIFFRYYMIQNVIEIAKTVRHKMWEHLKSFQHFYIRRELSDNIQKQFTTYPEDIIRVVFNMTKTFVSIIFLFVRILFLEHELNNKMIIIGIVFLISLIGWWQIGKMIKKNKKELKKNKKKLQDLWNKQLIAYNTTQVEVRKKSTDSFERELEKYTEIEKTIGLANMHNWLLYATPWLLFPVICEMVILSIRMMSLTGEDTDAMYLKYTGTVLISSAIYHTVAHLTHFTESITSLDADYIRLNIALDIIEKHPIITNNFRQIVLFDEVNSLEFSNLSYAIPQEKSTNKEEDEEDYDDNTEQQDAKFDIQADILSKKQFFLQTKGTIKFYRGINIIEGQSGAGKSTLLDLFADSVDHNKLYGQLELKMKSTHKDEKECTYTFQNSDIPVLLTMHTEIIPQLNKRMISDTKLSLREFLEIPDWIGTSDDSLIMMIIKELNLIERIKNMETYVSSHILSGGEAHRLALVKILYRTYKSNANIVIFDEIDSALDDINAIALANFIKKASRDILLYNKFILVVSHRKCAREVYLHNNHNKETHVENGIVSQ